MNINVSVVVKDENRVTMEYALRHPGVYYYADDDAHIITLDDKTALCVRGKYGVSVIDPTAWEGDEENLLVPTEDTVTITFQGKCK